MTVSAVTITTFEAANEGGFIYTNLLNSLTITGSTFTDFKALVAGSLIKSTSATNAIVLTSNTLNCATTASVASVHKSRLEQDPIVKGSTIEVVDATTTVISTGMRANSCYYGNKGGVFSLINSNLQDSGGIYSDISATRGGVYYCKSCSSLVVSSCTYTSIKSLYGSLFYVLRNELFGETYAIPTTTVSFTTVTINSAYSYV